MRKSFNWLFLGAALVAFRTDAAPPASNILPTVAITSPAQASTFAPPANLTLSANAADSDGTIAKVEFYQNSALITSDTTAPYATTLTGLAAGSYTLSAKATDSKGGVSALSSVTINVGAPKITIQGPVGNTSLAGDRFLVEGLVVGDPTAVVWVDNGQSTRAATLSYISEGSYRFSTYLPLYVGPNVLTATVVRRDKTHDSTTLNVTGLLSPSVEFTAPGTNLFDAPATISLAVNAASPNSAISQVRFLANNTPLTTVMAPPFAYTWDVQAAGQYEISAIAVDGNGYEATARKSITVRAPNVVPTVQISTPLDKASFDAPAHVQISATAGDSDGTIQSVEYFVDGALLSATNIAPYNVSWSGVAAGNYILTARAVDERGGVGMSAPVSVSVLTPKSLLQMTSPASGAVHTAPAAINLAVAAPQNTLAVTYYRTDTGTSQEIGSSAAAPFSFTWDMRTPGTFTVVAKALVRMDSSSEPLTLTSDPITVLVQADLSGETVTYLHNDFLGSPVAATDVNGALIWREDYQPYGERTHNSADASANRQFYAGKPLDNETGFSYMNARYYDPHAGRFMAMDPVGFDESNIQSFNRYAYANNSPYRFVDPDGRSPVDIAFLVVDVAKLGAAAYSGVGVGAALVDVGLSVVGVASPIPGTGQALKGIRAADRAADAIRGTENAVEAVAKKVNGNSHATTKPADGYTLRNRETGELLKFGETTRGKRRYSQKKLREKNIEMRFEAEGSKKEMHTWQHEKILEYKAANDGRRPPMNKSDY